MNFIRCTFEEHASAILEIFNEAIVTSTAMYDYEPRTLESMVSWFQTKEAAGFPETVQAPVRGHQESNGGRRHGPGSPFVVNGHVSQLRLGDLDVPPLVVEALCVNTHVDCHRRAADALHLGEE